MPRIFRAIGDEFKDSAPKTPLPQMNLWASKPMAQLSVRDRRGTLKAAMNDTDLSRIDLRCESLALGIKLKIDLVPNRQIADGYGR